MVACLLLSLELLARQMKAGPSACRSAFWPRAPECSRPRYQAAGSRRRFGASVSLYRHSQPTDARIKSLGKEIVDEYAQLRPRYGTSSPYRLVTSVVLDRGALTR